MFPAERDALDSLRVLTNPSATCCAGGLFRVTKVSISHCYVTLVSAQYAKERHPISSFCQRTCRRASCHFVNSAPSWDCSGISADGAPQGSTVSPFLRQFTKLPLLNLQDAPSLAFFLTQSRLRSRRVIPVLQRVLISLRRAARFPAVHPTAAVFHRCRSARLSTPLRSSPAARAQMHREFALHGLSTFRGDRSGGGSARNPK